MSDLRQKYLFAKLAGPLKRVTPVRLAVIDALNKGFEGSLNNLITDTAKRFGTNPQALRHFIKALDSAGYLTNTLPEPAYEGEPSGALGIAPDGAVTLATPVSLVTQSGKYLWFNHEGNLLLRLLLPEIVAAGMFSEAITIASAKQLYLAQEHMDKLDSDQFDHLVSRLAGAELFCRPYVKEDSGSGETRLMRTVTRASLPCWRYNRRIYPLLVAASRILLT